MQDIERRTRPLGIGRATRPMKRGRTPRYPPSTEHRAQRRWSAKQKAQIVRESFWPGSRVSDVAQRDGLTRKQWSAWRTLTRKGKLVVPSSTGPEAEPAFATLEVDPAPARGHLTPV